MMSFFSLCFCIDNASRYRKDDSGRGQGVGEKNQPFYIKQIGSGESYEGFRQDKEGGSRGECGVNECVEVSCIMCALRMRILINTLS